MNGLEAFNGKVKLYSPFEQENEIIEKELKEYEQYKTIEEDLSIDLLAREKALQNGAWYKSHSRGIVFCPFVRVVGKGKALELKEGQRTPTLCAKTYDYGKSWALTKEELL